MVRMGLGIPTPVKTARGKIRLPPNHLLRGNMLAGAEIATIQSFAGGRCQEGSKTTSEGLPVTPSIFVDSEGRVPSPCLATSLKTRLARLGLRSSDNRALPD